MSKIGLSILAVVTTLLLFAVLMLFHNGRASAQGNKSHAGLTSYTPTKLEWFVLYHEAYEGTRLTADSDYMLDIIERSADTAVILLQHKSTVDRSIINIVMNGVRNRLQKSADTQGYTWLKIREEIELLK